MEEQIEVVIETEASSSHTTFSSLRKFPVMLKHLLSSPAILFILLILFLATSTINILMHTSVLFQCLSFPILVCCSCIFSRLIFTVLLFSIERFLVMKTNKALYFVFALKTSVECFFLSSSILLSLLLFRKPDLGIFVVHFVTNTLATFVFATGMWILKNVILKVLDCQFHDKNFFYDMQNLISDENVFQTLLGPARRSNDSDNRTKKAHLKWIKEAFAKMFYLLCTRLPTICDALENSKFEDEHPVEHAVSMVYTNLTNKEIRDIQETDLLLVMKKGDIPNVLQLFDGAAETKSITEASLRKWMVKLCNQRKLLVHSLSSTSNVIEQLNKVVVVNLSFLVALVWCLVLGIEPNKFVVFMISSLLVIVTLSFGGYCKIISEGIMLAIVMHPYDIGDHCIIDHEKLSVQEIWLTNTVFVKENNEKVNCLNSALLTKSISNLNRSSELTDNFEIIVSSTTCSETIAALKLKIDELLGSQPESWHVQKSFDLKEIDDLKLKYNFQIVHARNFKNYHEKNYRRSELVSNLRQVLEEVDIKNFTIR
ncbi:hypothetical protein POM88_016624 [Heracleum sosnowskyi]|uniref:Mechanosensitive ion channel protein n=1 Tax=Heracleum sosnowskyi TaxID=360622 RepID=A0AAD8IMY6_9APIA|nr:hypothetical protein POM88_016624 [Heracleum sosnowskyi]